MLKFGKFVVKCRIPILILAVLLLLPSLYGMEHTRINYDMLTYLPDDLDTVKGQDILLKEFGKGAFSFIVIENMSDKDVVALKSNIEKVDHVDSVIWYDSIADISVPKELLPEKVYSAFNNGDATMMAVFFDSSSSSDETMQAITDIRAITGKQCYISGISALVVDLKNLCEREEPIYVAIAVACALAAMMIFCDSWIVPFVFLIGIGLSIVYNLGTNYFLGEISYITKALAAVLQLAVTMDYSIFLWHAYLEQLTLHPDKRDAMAYAIKETFLSVAGSSLTTIAGFIALCFMSYTMGMDLGIVMAKGVLLGVISSITILPSLILVLDKVLQRTRHKPLLPDMSKPSRWITKHYPVLLVIFAIIMVPATIGYMNKPIYYDFTKIMTSGSSSGFDEEDVQSLVANTKLKDYFDVATTHMVLCRSDMSQNDAENMIKEMEDTDGVKYVLGLNSVLGSLVPEDAVPAKLENTLKSGNWQLILINSSYSISTDECNSQLDTLKSILKKYDPNGMLIGEAACTKDLIEITDVDFKVVTWVSIGFIFLIIAVTMKSASLPFILVLAIESAIFVNLGIPYYTGTEMAFIGPVCISTIQLGSTVDYAILMTTRYKKERSSGLDKHDAITTALSTSVQSIITSAVGMFAATFGVAVYSEISVISTMCNLIARGALISMVSVLFVLPALLMLLDPIIVKTSAGFKYKKNSTEVI